MLRTSSYTIIVELPDGEFALAHGYTGALDCVSHAIGTRLLEGKEHFTSDNPEVDAILKSRGYLTEKGIEEENEYFKRVISLELKKFEINKKSNFTIVVTYDCNFNCPYCYEKDLFIDSPLKKTKVISEKEVDAIFNTIHQIEPEFPKRMKNISLFGGEPLLKDNLPIVKYIISKGKAEGYGFSVTSNGYDIDYYREYFGKGGIEAIQITLDGAAKINNKRRRHKEGVDTFDKIISNIKLALSNGVSVSLRVNVDYENKDDIAQLYGILESENILNSGLFSIYTEYISGVVNFNPTDYSSPDFSRFDYFSITGDSSYNIEYDRNVSSNIRNALAKKTKLSFKPKHCIAQSSAYVFDPFGNIYSCLDEIGKNDCWIGKYIPSLRWDDEVKNFWFDRDISIYPKCSRCKYALFCGGGCFSKQLISGRSVGYCDDFPLRFRYALKKLITTKQLHHEEKDKN